MSGRGRGRGRGIPIAYPDGWACKPAPTPLEAAIDATPAPLLELSAADRHTLALRRRLLGAYATSPFAVRDATRAKDFARYSDRYLDAPSEPFHKSRAMSIKVGLHFAPELLPPAGRSNGRKRSRGEGSGGAGGRAPTRRRLRKHADAELQLETFGSSDDLSGEDGEGEDGGERSRGRREEEEEGGVTEEEGEEEEEEWEEDGGYGDDVEDGDDDPIDDGDDEPTY